MQSGEKKRQGNDANRKKNKKRRKKAQLATVRMISVLLPAAIIVIAGAVLLTYVQGRRDKIRDAAAETGVMVTADSTASTAGNAQMESSQTGNTEVAETKESAGTVQSEDADPQQAGKVTGAAVDVTSLLSSGDVAETSDLTYGIDVAKYQGTIDWQKAASSGIQFAMIRVGYRTQVNGEICKDANAEYNLQQAIANKIKVGVYFFSTAVSTQEAVEEADWVADLIAPYQITYPVAYNCEGFQNADSRQNGLDTATRTTIADAFLKEIYQKGYTPMFYAAKNEMENNVLWDMTKLSSSYKVWVSQYPDSPYPQTARSSYTGTHAMWQYSNNATVPGITKPTDVNIAYFGYADVAAAKSQETPQTASASVEALMNFSSVNETVTAKKTVNLRDKPSQGADSSILFTLQNGDTATRTGTSNSGWSRVTYQDKTCYAVSSYLTTDLAAKAQAAQTNGTQQSDAGADGAGTGQADAAGTTDDGIKTAFHAVNENVTAKIEVNLRTKPSVTNPDATVAATLKNGEWVTRTGTSENGWSRVSYNGQTLYCVSSYLTTG